MPKFKSRAKFIRKQVKKINIFYVCHSILCIKKITFIFNKKFLQGKGLGLFEALTVNTGFNKPQ